MHTTIILHADHKFIDTSTPVPKHVLGQAAYQLAVLCALLAFSPSWFGVPDHATVTDGPSVHYTMVFNTFVMMQVNIIIDYYLIINPLNGVI